MLLYFVTIKCFVEMAAGDAGCPELFDPHLDQRHRSFLSSVGGEDIPVLRPRVPQELLRLDERWLPRYTVICFLYAFIVHY